MEPDSFLQHGEWKLGVRVWLEQAGQAVLGKGRFELLLSIDRWHSISEAARQMKMSYRHAWLLVQSINEAAGKPLVVASTGGLQGGGAQLTPFGHQVVAVFRELQGGLEQAAVIRLRRPALSPEAPSLHIAAPISLEDVLGQLQADYQLLQPMVRLRAVFGASDELAEHVLAGAPTDLFLSADARPLECLELVQLIKPGDRTLLAENTLAVIAPTEFARILRRPTDLLQPDLGRIALADRGSPLGRYTYAYLEAQGLYNAVACRAMYACDSRGVTAILQAGRADVGLVYGSDVTRANGCRLLFRVRPMRQSIRYVGAALKDGQHQEQAQAFLTFLSSRTAATRFRQCGFLPVRERRG